MEWTSDVAIGIAIAVSVGIATASWWWYHDMQTNDEEKVGDTNADLLPGLRILIVEDSFTFRSYLTHTLNKCLESPVIDTVSIGGEALELVKKNEPYDVIIMDENLETKMLGTEVTVAIREWERKQGRKGCLIIGGSSHKNPAFIEHAKACGQNILWGKPGPPPDQMKADLFRLLCS